jgi:hypothetical protein
MNPGTGTTSFWLQGRNAYGRVRTVEAPIRWLSAPHGCEPWLAPILVVLDTDSQAMEGNGLWPRDYPLLEPVLVAEWLEGRSFRIFQTGGTTPPTPDLLECATTVIWIHSSSLGDGGRSVLRDYHQSGTHLLPSYVLGGGNLILVGLQPSLAARWAQAWETTAPVPLPGNPLDFVAASTDAALLPHWWLTNLGIARVDLSVGNTDFLHPSIRLATAAAQVPGYPDLAFDPLTWPQGPSRRGFGFYDGGVQPAAGSEVLYTHAGTNQTLGIRRLSPSGGGGSVVYLGLHPYFVERPAFRQMISAALTDLGES